MRYSLFLGECEADEHSALRVTHEKAIRGYQLALFLFRVQPQDATLIRLSILVALRSTRPSFFRTMCALRDTRWAPSVARRSEVGG